MSAPVPAANRETRLSARRHRAAQPATRPGSAPDRRQHALHPHRQPASGRGQDRSTRGSARMGAPRPASSPPHAGTSRRLALAPPRSGRAPRAPRSEPPPSPDCLICASARSSASRIALASSSCPGSRAASQPAAEEDQRHDVLRVENRRLLRRLGEQGQQLAHDVGGVGLLAEQDQRPRKLRQVRPGRLLLSLDARLRPTPVQGSGVPHGPGPDRCASSQTACWPAHPDTRSADFARATR